MADQSKAPKERINITYRPATNTKEQKELPFRMAMLGDFTLRPDDTPLEERKMIRVDKDTFNDVMRSQELGVSVNVPNKLTGKEGDELAANLKFSTLQGLRARTARAQGPRAQQVARDTRGPQRAQGAPREQARLPEENRRHGQGRGDPQETHWTSSNRHKPKAAENSLHPRLHAASCGRNRFATPRRCHNGPELGDE